MADGPIPGEYPISSGTAELLGDADREHGWMLSVGDVPQSYVDLSEPTYLDFEYVRLMGDVIDGLAPGAAAIDAVHVGGAGCTLPRYVAATRAGSRQVVFEPDAALVQVVREHLALDTVPGLDVRIIDGRTGVAALPPGSADLVVVDAFTAAEMPIGLFTGEFTREVARVLRGGGVHLINVSDSGRLDFARRVVATMSGVFAHVMVLAEPEVLSGDRLGNLIVAGSPGPLPATGPISGPASGPVAGAFRLVSGGAAWARRLDGEELAGFRAGARPLHDPAPPVFGQH